MIIVAESGSTKTQWCKVSANGVEYLVNTPGINPVLMSFEEIQTSMRPVHAHISNEPITSIHYFGAGCASSSHKEKVGKVLYTVFGCDELWVDSDLIGACIATTGNAPAIVGLLGTGSNSCLWNGDGIEQQTPSLGYVLGDEGGGAAIGKQLVADFLKNQMPAHLKLLFSERYDISSEIAIQRVYQSAMPNRYLAGFAPFAEANIGEEYCRNLVLNQFGTFIRRNLLQYPGIDHLPVHFCGSIAWCHQNELAEAAKIHNVNIGIIEKEPISRIASYVFNKMFP